MSEQHAPGAIETGAVETGAIDWKTQGVKDPAIGLGVRFGDIMGEGDVEDGRKALIHTQTAEDLKGMGSVGTRKDDLLERDRLQKLDQPRVRTKNILNAHVVNKVEIFRRVDLMMNHQAAKR